MPSTPLGGYVPLDACPIINVRNVVHVEIPLHTKDYRINSKAIFGSVIPPTDSTENNSQNDSVR